MAAPEVLVSPREIPIGGHAVSLHASRREAAEHAARFLDGTPAGQPARFWVTDDRTAAMYAEAAKERSPEHVGCIAILPTEQVEEVDGRLRPVAEVRAYVGAHPGGVTAAGGTISAHLTAENMPAHAEYEAWFDGQAGDRSRFLCPYDLRGLPPESAPEFLRELGAHHSHVVLSHSDEPGARLLELFIFDTPREMPDELRPALAWALDRGLVSAPAPDASLELTPSGEAVVREWGEHSSLDY